MKSVRIAAAGAVAFACLSFMTAPVRACDDRFAKQCETESAPPPEADAAVVVTRRKPAHLRAALARPERLPRRLRAARPMLPLPPTEHAVVPPPAPTLASDEQHPVTLPPESPMARRFHGFIDPQSMTVNSFEALRKPRLDAEHLTPMPTLPPNDASAAATDEPTAPEAAPVAPVAKPAAVATAPAQAAPLATQPVEAGVTASPIVSAPPPVDTPPARFPAHHLVLALCGALGVAAALRFIVGT